MSESQTEFLQRQVISLTKENHLLKEDILAFHHFLNNKVKELKTYLRDVPGRYLNMELCDISQALTYVKEDSDYYQKLINTQIREIKLLKTNIEEVKVKLNQQEEIRNQKLTDLEVVLTDQYTQALKEIKESLQLVTSNCDIYRNSTFLLANEKQICENTIKNLNQEIENLKNQLQKEQTEFNLALQRGKQQLSDTEKVYALRLHKVQQQIFEEYQTKLKNQAQDINDKDQQRLDQEKKIINLEKQNQEFSLKLSTIQDQLKELQEQQKNKIIECQNLLQINDSLNTHIKQLQIQIENKNHQIKQKSILSDELQQKLLVEQQQYLQQQECIHQIFQDLCNVVQQNNDILKQQSIKSQFQYVISQIQKKYDSLNEECKQLNKKIVNIQDKTLSLQEEISSLNFQNEILQQKNNTLQEQILTDQEFELKYRKLVNEIVYIAQSDPFAIKSLQKQLPINLYKEYTQLNQISEKDQNRPLFLLSISQESVEQEDDKQFNNQINENQTSEQTVIKQNQSINELEQKVKTQPTIIDFQLIEQDLSQLDNNQSVMWKNSLKMTLTPSLNNKNENKIEIQDNSTQTDRKRYHSQFIPHNNLDEIVQDIKSGYVGYIDTLDNFTQTEYLFLNKCTQTQYKKQSQEENQEQKVIFNKPTQNLMETNMVKQLDSQSTKIAQLNKIIKQQELQIKEQLFQNDKLQEDFEIKSRELQRQKEFSKCQLQDQMVEYENKLVQQSSLYEEQIKNINIQNNKIIDEYQQQIKEKKQQIMKLKDTLENKCQYIITLEKNKEQNLNQIQFLEDNLKSQSLEFNIQTQQLNQQIQDLKEQYQNRPSREEDVEKIIILELENERLQDTLTNSFSKIEHANEIVKYLQIEVENYKKQYNLFTNHKPNIFQRKKQKLIDSTIEDEKSIVFDSKPDFLPNVTIRDNFSNDQKKSKRSRSYKLQDFEIKQHANRIFFKNANNTQQNNHFNKTQFFVKPNSPSQKTTRYQQSTQRKFVNPFDNECILHNAEVLIENIKTGSPRTKSPTKKSNDQFFLKGYKEYNSTSQSKQRI